MPTDITPAEAAKILEHPESHAFGYTALLLEACKTAASVLRKLAAGELREVVHAHWHDDWRQPDGRVIRDCSVCHGRTSEFTSTPICPWCGAIMDGGGTSGENSPKSTDKPHENARRKAGERKDDSDAD